MRTAIIGIDFLSHFGLLVNAKLGVVRGGMAKPLQQSARVPSNRSANRGGLFAEASAESLSASVEARFRFATWNKMGHQQATKRKRLEQKSNFKYK